MIGKNINIYPGKIIKFSEMNKIDDRSDLTDYLKAKTYELRNLNSE